MILFKDAQIIASGEKIEQKIVLEAGQRADYTLVAIGGGQADFDIDIVGPEAELQLRGLYICRDEQRLGVNVQLCHSAGGSISNQLFRGIVDGNARASFSGRIVVAHDAQKTEAYQTNQNLQLSDSAVCETSPQLEIYADDVKCSHGATVGSLDPNEQFYMRSRGISEFEARRLQMMSFLAPVMEKLSQEVKDEVFLQL